MHKQVKFMLLLNQNYNNILLNPNNNSCNDEEDHQGDQCHILDNVDHQCHIRDNVDHLCLCLILDSVAPGGPPGSPQGPPPSIGNTNVGRPPSTVHPSRQRMMQKQQVASGAPAQRTRKSRFNPY
eukprot:UN09905